MRLLIRIVSIHFIPILNFMLFYNARIQVVDVRYHIVAIYIYFGPGPGPAGVCVRSFSFNLKTKM